MKYLLSIVLLFGMSLPVMAQTDPSVSKKGSMKVRKKEHYTSSSNAEEELERIKKEAEQKAKEALKYKKKF